MRSFCVALIGLFSFVAVGCVEDDSGTSDGPPNPELRAQAQAESVSNSGKNDLGEDLCEEYGFYADGWCDHWCPIPDTDCGPCDYPTLYCAADELAVDTNDTGCADTCVINPDYHPPGLVALGDPCPYVDDCQEDAYCYKEFGRCDDGEPGVCTLKPDCGGVEEFVLELVCGCDGYSAANPCEAARVGQNLRHEGLCE